jgi:hypothetical protein
VSPRAACALALGLWCGCGPVDLTVISIDAGDLPTPGQQCTTAIDCDSGEYCEKLGCGDTFGSCAAAPFAGGCPAEGLPVCGCDGVNYWNDCLRRAAGVAANLELGQCSRPRPCGPGNECPGDAVCALLLPRPTDCGRPFPPRCWAVPTTCSSREQFLPCGQPPACFDLCAAARSGVQMFEARMPCP